MSASGLLVRAVVGLHERWPATPPFATSQRSGSPHPTFSADAISPCFAFESCIFISLPGRKLPYSPLKTGIGLRVELSLFLCHSSLSSTSFPSDQTGSKGGMARDNVSWAIYQISRTCYRSSVVHIRSVLDSHHRRILAPVLFFCRFFIFRLPSHCLSFKPVGVIL